MLTTDLFYRLQNYRFFRSGAVSLNSEKEVYIPANDAQNEICTSLRAIESQCNLALVTLQEQYSYTPAQIASSTQVNPSVITTSSAHGLTTGDSVIITGHLINTAINGNWPSITVLSPTTFSVPVLGNGVGAATGTVYHQILQAFETFQATKTGTNYGILEKKEKWEIDASRWQYMNASSQAAVNGVPPSASTAGVPNRQVNRFYELWDNTYTFGIQGIPSTAGIVLLLNFYRIPLSFQQIASGINPILPPMYDRALFLGTVKYYLESLEFEGKVKKEDYTETLELFEGEKSRLSKVISEQRRPKPQVRQSFLKSL